MSVSLRSISLFAAMLSIPVALSAAEDPLMGTWKLKMDDGKLVTRTSIRKHEPIPNGMKVIRDGPYHAETTVMFDDQYHSYTGDPNVTSVMYKRYSPYVVFTIAKIQDKVTATIIWEVSQDGKTMTRYWTRVLPPNGPSFVVEVYEKQVK